MAHPGLGGLHRIGRGLHLATARTPAGARPLALSAFLLAAVCLLVAAEVSTTDPRVLAMWFVLADAIMLPAAPLGGALPATLTQEEERRDEYVSDAREVAAAMDAVLGGG